MDITWLGHAAFSLHGNGRTVLVDPVPMEYCGSGLRSIFSSLKSADIILLTHEHMDHCNPQSIAPLRTSSTVIIGPEACREKLKGSVQVIAPGETMRVGPIGIQAVHAYNIVREREPGSPFHPRGAGLGYVLTLDEHTVYHAGDTELIPEMKEIAPVDIALLPVDGHYTMPPDEAMQCAASIKAGTTVPMHYFETPVERVLAAAKAHPGTNIQILEIGEHWIPF